MEHTGLTKNEAVVGLVTVTCAC